MYNNYKVIINICSLAFDNTFIKNVLKKHYSTLLLSLVSPVPYFSFPLSQSLIICTCCRPSWKMSEPRPTAASMEAQPSSSRSLFFLWLQRRTESCEPIPGPTPPSSITPLLPSSGARRPGELSSNSQLSSEQRETDRKHPIISVDICLMFHYMSRSRTGLRLTHFI